MARKKEKEETEVGEEMMEINRGREPTEVTSTEVSNWAMVLEPVQTAFR